MRILLVDDNKDSLKSLTVVLTDLGHEPTPFLSAFEAYERACAEYFPLIIADIRMPGMDGLELLAKIKADELGRHSDVVLITGHGDMETAVDALRKGAYDYLNKPINARELAAVVERSAEHQSLLMENQEFKTRFKHQVEQATVELRKDLDRMRSALREIAGVGRIVAESRAMRQLLEEASIYHQNPGVPVLLEGETGVGKEVVAKRIHYGDGRVDTPFVAINCAAIPSELFESELFGHEAGAYTGSTRKGQPGKVELAGNGTLFLDEVAELPEKLQPKLLRVLEDKTFYRVGGVKKRRLEARVICAANRTLRDMVLSGKFRRDLYHRLKVGHLVIPPLRMRKEEIEPLAMLFLEREAERKKKRFVRIHPTALRVLMRYDWPGNVRELENVIERAVLTSDHDELLPEHFAFFHEDAEIWGDASVPPSSSMNLIDLEALQLPDTGLDLEALNSRIIVQAMSKFGGNKTKVALYLGMSRFALYRRLKRDDEEN